MPGAKRLDQLFDGEVGGPSLRVLLEVLFDAGAGVGLEFIE